MRDPSGPRDSTCLLSLVTHTVLYFSGFASLGLQQHNTPMSVASYSMVSINIVYLGSP